MDVVLMLLTLASRMDALHHKTAVTGSTLLTCSCSHIKNFTDKTTKTDFSFFKCGVFVA